MARRLRPLVRSAAPLLRPALPFLLAALLAASGPVLAAPSPSPTPASPTTPAAPATVASPTPSPAKPPKPDEWTQANRMFDQLSPDQKKKFLDNLARWKAMSPEEQELFRDRELFRSEQIAVEIEQAISKSGLHLDDDQREVYALRYTQERRKIEEALHKEMEAKRQAMVSAVLARLKVEFSSTPAPSPAPP